MAKAKPAARPLVTVTLAVVGDTVQPDERAAYPELRVGDWVLVRGRRCVVTALPTTSVYSKRGSVMAVKARA